MTWQEYRVEFRPRAERGLKSLAKKLGKTHFQKLREAVLDLRFDPAGKTRELYGALVDYRSLHFGRCRIIIKISDVVVTVYVVAAGWHASGDRDDVYQQFIRALEQEAVDPLDSDESDSPGSE